MGARLKGAKNRDSKLPSLIQEPNVTCLAMLGCHELDGTHDPTLGKEVFDFNVVVNRIVHDDSLGVLERSETFKITKDGGQDFYDLSSE